MGFHSPVFLVGFLPACVLIVLLAGRRFRKEALLAASLAFYAWNDWRYLPLIAGLILLNYFIARFIQHQRIADDDASAGALASRARARLALAGAIGLNLLVLIFFKLLVSYGEDGQLFGANRAQAGWPAHGLLPLGLSYITFQLIAYIVDVRNEMIDSETNLWKFSLYVLFFPKIVTGPIARYRDFSEELNQSTLGRARIAEGARRFIVGLGKKVLIADTLGRLVDPSFALPAPLFSSGMAWLVVISFGLQLYFDFSGSIDMAIGLGNLFGLKLPENFNLPYLSRSIGEFWRRWHMTLSAWFRDYVFYPLEFTRRREDRFRQQMHALAVFLLTGLWHGLTLNFALWGLIHGAAIAVESLGFGRRLKKAWPPLQHGYTLSIVLLGWVFFRSPTTAFAAALLARMFGGLPGLAVSQSAQGLTLTAVESSLWLALLIGILLSLPVVPAWQERWQVFIDQQPRAARPARVAVDFFLLLLLLACMAVLVQKEFIPAIYSCY